MSRRNLTIITLLLLSSLMLVGVVSADTVRGEGWLQAQGAGVTTVRGQVDVLEIGGHGALWYRDRGEVDEPVVTGEGRRIEHDNGWVQYVGFNGRFQLTDADDVFVSLTGQGINLYAEGQGTVFLRGRGTYTYGSGETTTNGHWSINGRSLELEE
ncbi:MAG: hypothetical protein CSA11_07720 [Chloroflexi bacterium]|nr:MAG: hypothetical protein CSB13_08005 [Chloroflexota bacterium]PIE80480.1 MAG: hypothetical protein CSA11_07720 [Chloroflexota bacterium]